MVRSISFLVVAVAACPAYGALTSVQWNGKDAHLHFDDENDWVHLAQDDQGYLTLQSEPGSFDLGPRVLSDNNALIPAGDIDTMLMHLSGGDDQLVGTSFSITGEAFFFGGPGDDELRLPYSEEGSQLWAWGGDGDDLINAYDSYETYSFGGNGDDGLMGGYQGYHVKDPGPGLNQIVYGARYGQTDIFYHPGSDLSVVEIYAAPTNYFLSPGSNERVGNLSVFDPFGSNDTITLNGHPFDVDGSTIVADWVAGSWNNWDGVTVLDGQASASTPEPSTMTLVILSAMLWACRRFVAA